MEYLGKVFYEVNQENAKNIVFHLSQHRDREISRRELLSELGLNMSDGELEQKLHSLVKADIIEQGSSNMYYRGVQDNMFDKVFRGQYADDIRTFDPQEIRNEYKAMYEKALHDLHVMTGKYSQVKGQFAKFAVINQLRLHATDRADLLCSITRNLPNDAIFRQNLIELLQGGQAHMTPKDVLTGIQPELRHVRPAESLHSVWEELEHLRIAQEDILRYTLDASWQSPSWPDGYWPAPTDQPTEERWSASVAGFFADLDDVIALVQNTDIDLTAHIPHGEGRTYLREVLLVADHNAYHLGQIVQTRKLLGNWHG